VFTDKKSLRKRDAFNPYYLLALIPFLLGGIYFLSGGNIETTTPEIKVEPSEMVRNFAQEETKEINQETKIDKVEKETKSNITPKVFKQEKQSKNGIKKQESTNKVYFASSENQESSSIPKITLGKMTPVSTENKNIQNPEIKLTEAIAEERTTSQTQSPLQEVASLETLPIKSLEKDVDLGLMTATVASITPKNKNLIDQIIEKNSWLEMVTPASFENLDLKESLAIESNENVNTSRKILNAFIPESLVK